MGLHWPACWGRRDLLLLCLLRRREAGAEAGAGLWRCLLEPASLTLEYHHITELKGLKAPRTSPTVTPASARSVSIFLRAACFLA